MISVLSEVSVLSVTCPRCAAVSEAPCLTVSGAQCDPHVAREKELARAMRLMSAEPSKRRLRKPKSPPFADVSVMVLPQEKKFTFVARALRALRGSGSEEDTCDKFFEQAMAAPSLEGAWSVAAKYLTLRVPPSLG